MQTLLRENRHTLKLALPIMTGQLGQMLLGLTDTLMIGRVGTVELAAAAFVNVLVHLVLVAGIGLAAAVSVQVSHAHGSKDSDATARHLRHGFWVAVIGGGIMAGLLAASPPVLSFLGQKEDVLALTPPYLRWVAASLLFYMPSMIIKNFAEARHHPWPVFWIMLSGVLLNVGFNTLLIFGKAGFPAMGIEGAGLATFLARLLTFVGLWVYLRHSRHLRDGLPVRWLGRLDFSELKALFRIATPITGQMSLEFGAFAASALLIGFFGSVPLAAHQIAITCAATTFMIPLGISMAVSIRVGHSLGSGRRSRARRIVFGAQGMASAAMLLFALIYLLAGGPIADAFTPDPALAALTVQLLAVTGIFQVFDGIQIVSMGALRAFKDVHVPTGILFFSYGVVGMPLGVYLAFAREMGALGLWLGLAGGLALAAALLSLRLAKHLRRDT